MQVDPRYTCHQYTKECQVGVERKKEWEAAVMSALALRQQFSIYGDVLERVEVFKYLRRLLAQGDDDIRAICTIIEGLLILQFKNKGTWFKVANGTL